MSLEQKTPLRIACFGEAMAELSLSGGQSATGLTDDSSTSLGFAGDTMNTAIYLKRLMGEGAEVSYVTVVGKDPLSERLIGRLESESISTKHVKIHDELLVGIYAITTDDTGERTFSYWRSNSAARTLFQSSAQNANQHANQHANQQNGQKEVECNFELLVEFDVIYFSAISLAVLPMAVRQSLFDALRELKDKHTVQIVFDSNYRPALWESKAIAQQMISDAWRLCDIALPSIDDEQNLFDDVNEAALLERLSGYGITQGALKRGAEGPLSLSSQALSSNGERPDWLNEVVSVVDTTAAGDSFNAGYLSAALIDGQQSDALRAGHACASRVIAHHGAIIPMEEW